MRTLTLNELKAVTGGGVGNDKPVAAGNGMVMAMAIQKTTMNQMAHKLALAMKSMAVRNHRDQM